MAKYLIKSSGEIEQFSEEKLRRSLGKAGASETIIKEIANEIIKRPDLDTTQKIYDYAYNQLKGIYRPLAARYSLKNALYELGPEGKLFEQFVAHLFTGLGFSTELDVIERGMCVDHEIDVSLKKNNEHSMVECKFHNRRGIKTDVKVALYIRARYEDLAHQTAQNRPPYQGVWLVTNTQFTTEAIKYGTCANINLLGWAYPHDKGLGTLVDTLDLHPITSLTCLTRKQKRMILGQNIILCRDLIARPDILKQLGIMQVKKITDECKALCPSSNY